MSSSSSRNNKKSKKPIETTLGKAEPAVEQDVAELRQPIITNLNGIKQILQILQDATLEVKNYIMYECDVIYECKVCQSLFRSLANFILHKRKYCKQNSTRHHTTPYQEIVTSEIDPIHPTSNPLNTCKKFTLDSIINNLHQSEQIKQDIQQLIVKDLSSDPDSKSIKNMDDRAKAALDYTKIILETIDNSKAAVFQTVQPVKLNNQEVDEIPSTKSEVMEIHKHLINDVALLNADGKIEKFTVEKPNTALGTVHLQCSQCKRTFTSKRSLIDHVKLHHNLSKMLYQCPSCKNLFANPWCVYRHLLKVHKLSNKQIKRMREQINNNWIFRMDDSANTKKKKTSNEQQEKVETNVEYQWIKDIEGDKDFQMCAGCGKHFERKAALNSHSQMCVKRLEMCNSIEQNAKKKREEALAHLSEAALNDKQHKGASKRKQSAIIMYRKTISENQIKVDTEKDQIQINIESENSDELCKQNVQSPALIDNKVNVENEVDPAKADTEKVPDQIIVINEQNVDKCSSSSIKENKDKCAEIILVCSDEFLPQAEASCSATDEILKSILTTSKGNNSNQINQKNTEISIDEPGESKLTDSKNGKSSKLLKDDSVSSDLPTFESFYQKTCKESNIDLDNVNKNPVLNQQLQPRSKKRRLELTNKRPVNIKSPVSIPATPCSSSISGESIENQKQHNSMELDNNKPLLVQACSSNPQIDVGEQPLKEFQQLPEPIELSMPADISNYIRSFGNDDTITQEDVINQEPAVQETSPPQQILCDDSNDEWDIPLITRSGSEKSVKIQLNKCNKTNNIVVTNVQLRPCRNRTKRKQSEDFVYYEEETNINIFTGRVQLLKGKHKTYNNPSHTPTLKSNVQKKK